MLIFMLLLYVVSVLFSLYCIYLIVKQYPPEDYADLFMGLMLICVAFVPSVNVYLFAELAEVPVMEHLFSWLFKPLPKWLTRMCKS